MPQSVTEESKIQEEWYEQANEINTPDELAEFARRLLNDYTHDYGTVCHATAAIALAGAHMAAREQGITGFQAGAVQWEFIRHWDFDGDGPMRLVHYSNMLYPQYAREFGNTITPETWEWLQEKAQENLDKTSGPVNSSVVEHWLSIVNGNIPFGYTIREDI